VQRIVERSSAIEGIRGMDQTAERARNFSNWRSN
jgi:hypothetical protein